MKKITDPSRSASTPLSTCMLYFSTDYYRYLFNVQVVILTPDQTEAGGAVGEASGIYYFTFLSLYLSLSGLKLERI